MKVLLKTLILLITLPFVSICMAEGTTTSSENEHASPTVTVQVIHNQLNLDDDAIESATIDYPNDPTQPNTYGVYLKLNKAAADQFQELTQESMGQQINIILNGVLVSSPTIQSSLGDQMLISGLTEEQALQFIQRLDIK